MRSSILTSLLTTVTAVIAGGFLLAAVCCAYHDEPRDGARAVLKGHTNWVTAVSFAPDGKLLASTSVDKSIRFWEPLSGRVVRVVQGRANSVEAITYAANGDLFATGESSIKSNATENSTDADAGVVQSWKIGGVSSQRVFQVPKSSPPYLHYKDGVTVPSVAFSADSRMLAAGVRRQNLDRGSIASIVVWEVATGRASHIGIPAPSNRGTPPWVPTKRDANIPAVAYVLDGKVLAATDGEQIALWDVAEMRLREVLPATDRSEFSGYSCLASAGGALLVAGETRPGRHGKADLSCRVIVWDASTGKQLAVLGEHAGSVLGVAMAPSGQYVASVGRDGVARVWSIPDKREIAVFRGHIGPVRAVAFSPDGRTLATGGEDGTLRLWDVPVDPGKR